MNPSVIFQHVFRSHRRLRRRHPRPTPPRHQSWSMVAHSPPYPLLHLPVRRVRSHQSPPGRPRARRRWPRDSQLRLQQSLHAIVFPYMLLFPLLLCVLHRFTANHPIMETPQTQYPDANIEWKKKSRSDTNSHGKENEPAASASKKPNASRTSEPGASHVPSSSRARSKYTSSARSETAAVKSSRGTKPMPR